LFNKKKTDNLLRIEYKIAEEIINYEDLKEVDDNL